jgi:phosphoserine phosphatase
VSGRVPVVVDLDGTLIGIDSLRLLRTRLRLHKPWLERRRRVAYRRGKQFEKVFLWDEVPVDVMALPVNDDLLAVLAGLGNEHVLATGSSAAFAADVASRVGIFERVVGSDESVNLTGPAKAKALVELFGSGGFDYVGDSWADLPVWAEARRAYVCSDEQDLLDAVARMTATEQVPCRVTRRRDRWRLALLPIRAPERVP